MAPHRACLICGCRSFSRLYPLSLPTASGTPYWIVRCAECRTHCVDPPVSVADIRTASDAKHFAIYSDPAVAGTKIRDLERAMKKLGSRRVTTALEVGCNLAYLTESLRQSGVDAIGIELDEAVAGAAVDRLPDAVICGDFLEHDFTRHAFDLILMVDVLEHFFDPVAALRKAHDLLTDQGQIMIITPDSGSWFRAISRRRWVGYFVEHINCFSVRSIRQAADASGLSLERKSVFLKTVTLGYAGGMAAHRYPRLKPLKALSTSWLRGVRIRVFDDSMLLILAPDSTHHRHVLGRPGALLDLPRRGELVVPVTSDHPEVEQVGQQLPPASPSSLVLQADLGSPIAVRIAVR